MNGDSAAVSVVVVDDEQDIADLYTTWLSMEYDVRTAYDGDEALEQVDETVDVVFLDRQMPGKSGDEVLDRIDERGVDCRVVMVTAVDPDFDIVEMPFDDYLTKPVTREELDAKVEEMLTRETYDERMQEYFAAASKKATLESQRNSAELDAHEEYHTVSQRVERLRAEATESVEEFDDFESVFREFPGG
ncbi:response regulator [Haloarcula pelagica]|uniref:response regulator n=1 Tax=Haloarcula pelagica TaxID=3033389 RepID=UPI0024C262A1|nr:response regulator [Halomicroarcula sp. YJ-61-S]